MKINTHKQLDTGITLKKSAPKKEETVKDQVIFGQGKEDLGIMEMPLESIKSTDGAGVMAGIFVGAAAAGGALLAGIGMAGKTIGGLPGAVVAVGLTAVAGGIIAHKQNDNIYYSRDKMKNMAKQAGVAGGIALAGALMSDVSKLGALGTGAALGAGSIFLPDVVSHHGLPE